MAFSARSGESRERASKLARLRLVFEAALAVILTVVVYVQTDRIADQAAKQNEALMRWSEIQENVRFVRETAIGDSLVLPFTYLDLQYASLTNIHFGCTDSERKRAQSWKDYLSDPRYPGVGCRADFSDSNLSYSDLRGAQLYLAYFQRTKLYRGNLAYANLSQAKFQDATLDGAHLDKSLANGALFQSTSLSGTVFRDASLRYAEFIDVDLGTSDFRGAKLYGAKFTGVSCEGTKWPTGFRPPAACVQ